MQVYESCEALFCTLADELQKYSDWLALGETGDFRNTHAPTVGSLAARLWQCCAAGHCSSCLRCSTIAQNTNTDRCPCLAVCVVSTAGEDLEDMVEQQLWGSDDGESSSSSGRSSLATGAADDQGMAAWELNMKALKTAAYDLGRLPNDVGAEVQPLALAWRLWCRCCRLLPLVTCHSQIALDVCKQCCSAAFRCCCAQVRIDVYCVRLNAFKAYVEEMIKRLREALAASLRKRVSTNQHSVLMARCAPLVLLLPDPACPPPLPCHKMSAFVMQRW